MTNKNKILNKVNSYYTEKILTHGSTPQGVDWNSKDSQEIRFNQLIKVFDNKDNINLLDFGAGYGALYQFLLQQNSGKFKYTGYDISEEMTNKGKELYGETSSIAWQNSLPKEKKYDYTIASGIFNVRMNIVNSEWQDYIFDTLNKINALSTKGFSFNLLTSYSDNEFMRDNLYYAQPEELFAYCKKKFSCQVALLHDYNLYEFTILVRK